MMSCSELANCSRSLIAGVARRMAASSSRAPAALHAGSVALGLSVVLEREVGSHAVNHESLEEIAAR